MTLLIMEPSDHSFYYLLIAEFFFSLSCFEINFVDRFFIALSPFSIIGSLASLPELNFKKVHQC